MPHLLTVSIGPVQEFIAAARRTRDLWFGSQLLSEISKAVARAISAEPAATLIFPAPADQAQLKPGDHLSAANLLLARLEDSLVPKDFAEALRNEATRFWKDQAQKVRRSLEDKPWYDWDRFDSQLDGFLELYCAWYPVAADDSDYQTARAALMRILAGRKNARKFTQWHGIAGVPKSSLDGARETVLLRLKGEAELKRMARVKLNAGEQLDAIGLIKRQGGTRRQYPSVSRIAAEPWLYGLTPQDRARLIAVCRPIAEEPAGLVRLDPKRFPQFVDFPYERSAVYRNRIDEAVEEAEPEARQRLRQPLEKILRELDSPKAYGEPNPYLAILAADGDGMGRTIAKLANPDRHRAFSQALSRFAASASEVVTKAHGSLVYSGGDDVLAFVPVHQVLECAAQLNAAFHKELDTLSDATLSVGIAIGHMMDPLEDLLEYARAAEKLAKHPTPDHPGQQPKDALAISLYPRNGPPVSWRANWPADPVTTLLRFVGLFLDDRIPSRAAYHLEELARLLLPLQGPRLAPRPRVGLPGHGRRSHPSPRPKGSGR